MHIDFDYFYAQCEELRDPKIKDKPVIVCVYSARGNESGAVSTANYHARRYGVRSGMPIKFAKDKLRNTDAVFLPVDHEYYDTISQEAMSIIRKYADKFEYVGDDEAYIDVSKRVNNFDDAKELALLIKNEIKNKIGLSISIGIAENKLLAKIASGYNKPDGLTIVRPEDTNNFLDELDVSKIIGIGEKTRERLNELAITKIKDLKRISVYKLMEEFGKKTGIYLYNAARGIDEESVNDKNDIKQFSRIVTLKKDSDNIDDMLEDLNILCKEVHKIIIENNFFFKSVGILVTLNDLSIRSKSRTLRNLSNSYDDILKVSKTLLEEIMQERIIVRRLGVKVSDLVSNKGQDTLLKFIK